MIYLSWQVSKLINIFKLFVGMEESSDSYETAQETTSHEYHKNIHRRKKRLASLETQQVDQG